MTKSMLNTILCIIYILNILKINAIISDINVVDTIYHI